MYIYRSIEAVSLILLSKEPNHFQCGLDAPKIRAWSVCSRGSFMFFPVEMCCKYVGGSKNRGTPNHPKLDHFSIETHGDLGYLHFRNSPFVANMYTQCIYVTCTTWHRMQLSRRAHTHTGMWDPCVSMISLAFVFVEESMNPGAQVDRTTSPGCLNIFIMFSQGSTFSIFRSLVLPPKWLDKSPACTFCSLNPHWFGFWKKEVPVNVLRNPILG